MSKKFSITKTIDIDKLKENISLYRYETGEMSPYIFMNNETIKAMNDEYFKLIDPIAECYLRSKCANGLLAKYEGYKIFLDNELKFGEVEIR